MRFSISTMSPKGYTGLHNKADSIEKARAVAKDSIVYAEKHFNDGTPIGAYYAEIRNDRGLLIEKVTLNS